MTKKGERVINGGIGTNIPALLGSLFEQIVPAELEVRIRSEIESALRTWMPEVSLVALKIYSEINAQEIGASLDSNQVLVRMKYVLKNADQLVDSVQLTLSP